MQLTRLRLTHFKNYASGDFQFEKRLCAIAGKNGAGKTNLLDAIHHVSLGRSAFHKQDAFQIRHDASFYRLDADLKQDGQKHRMELVYSPEDKKKLIWDGARAERLADHVGRLPLVLILPDEPFQMNESAEWRRSFVDSTLSQAFPLYLRHLMDFKKLLAQRNATLKYFADGRRIDLALLDAIDNQIINHTTFLYAERKNHLPQLDAHVQAAYLWLSNNAESVSIGYKTELDMFDIQTITKRNLAGDIDAQRTQGGVHKDDYVFEMDGRPLKKTGSQGQQKTFLLGLKLAQYRFLRHHRKVNPWLLMDDIFDKLDDVRIGKLVELIHQPEMGQVFLTDARPERTKQWLLASSPDYQTIEI